MQVKIITLKYDPLIGRIDDSSLIEFIKDKEVISVRDHFFMKDDSPNLIIVVTYKQNSVLEPSIEQKFTGRVGEKWRELLSDDELPLFNTIRNWRAERAKQDGVPLITSFCRMGIVYGLCSRAIRLCPGCSSCSGLLPDK